MTQILLLSQFGHFYLLLKVVQYRKNLYVFLYQDAMPVIYNINAKMAVSKERRYYFYCEQNRIRHSCRLKSLLLSLFIKLAHFVIWCPIIPQTDKLHLPQRR